MNEGKDARHVAPGPHPDPRPRGGDQSCHPIRPHCRRGRFAWLLACLLSLFTLRPFLADVFGLRLLMDIFFSMILISGAYAVSQHRVVFLIGIGLAVPALLAGWMPYFWPGLAMPKMLMCLEMLFLGYTAGVILVYLFKETHITGDLITGAVCVYFLIGLTWSVAYGLLEMVEPGAFSSEQVLDLSQFVYFSFVTLTTLGYGDITPVNAAARSLSMLEAVMGQLYLAILIARLVGMHVAHGNPRS